MTAPEVWLRGAIPNVPALLQPVAHSLLQCREEIRATIPDLSLTQIWSRPGDAAAIGYHVRHAAGALDRLFTYARSDGLSPTQRAALASEERLDESHVGQLVTTAKIVRSR